MSDRYERVSAFEVAEFKALDSRTGEFEALVSVFGNVDKGGDRVVKGAFAKSLARWEESGDPIPVIWNHMWENPEAHIGAVPPGSAMETADGLVVKGRLDLDNPFAKQVYRLLSERRVKEFSFGYNLRDAEKKDGALDLLEIDLFEVGPTLKGMNPATELLAVKALAAATEGPPPMSTFPVIVDPEERRKFLMNEHEKDDTKAGARHSKATQTFVRQHIDAMTAHFFPGDTAEEPTKSDEAETPGKASDPDADLMTQIQILEET